MAVAHRVVSEQTSESMRYLMRSNATHGSAGFANVDGYYVGGKTGTADKIVHGHYSQDKVFTTFMAITPADKPKYLYLVMYDEPQALPEDGGYHTAAHNAGRITGRLIERVEPLEGVPPASQFPTSRSRCLRASAMATTRTRWARSEASRRNPRSERVRRRAGFARDRRAFASTAARSGPATCSSRFRASRATASPTPRKPLAKGASVIVAERAPDFAAPAFVRVADARAALARAAARFYPRQPELVVAVTGTSGKTSVAAFVRQIWASLGFEAASLGTIGVVSRPLKVYGSLTTPDPIALHETLDRLAEAGVTHLALEASSHGLDQKRLDGVRLTAGAFTNLSRDHMDYHATTEDYLAAKLRLFRELLPAGAPAVIDADSEVAPRVGAAARERGLRPVHGRGERRPICV